MSTNAYCQEPLKLDSKMHHFEFSVFLGCKNKSAHHINNFTSMWCYILDIPHAILWAFLLEYANLSKLGYFTGITVCFDWMYYIMVHAMP